MKSASIDLGGAADPVAALLTGSLAAALFADDAFEAILSVAGPAGVLLAAGPALLVLPWDELWGAVSSIEELAALIAP